MFHRFASDDLKMDVAFLRECALKHGLSARFAAEEVRQDPEFENDWQDILKAAGQWQSKVDAEEADRAAKEREKAVELSVDGGTHSSDVRSEDGESDIDNHESTEAGGFSE
jgi:hypothetical protein